MPLENGRTSCTAVPTLIFEGNQLFLRGPVPLHGLRTAYLSRKPQRYPGLPAGNPIQALPPGHQRNGLPQYPRSCQSDQELAKSPYLRQSRRYGDSFRQRLPARLVSDMLLPLHRIGCGTRHDDLDGYLVVIALVVLVRIMVMIVIILMVLFPVGPDRGDGVVEPHADAAAHADDHRLAVHRLQAVLEMLQPNLRRLAGRASPRRRELQAAPIWS